MMEQRWFYSPHTGELIRTDTPAAWMGATELAPPEHDPQVSSAMFRDGAWQVVHADPEPFAVPAQVSRFQARAAIYQAGLFDAVEALMANPATPMLTRLAWADAQVFQRDSDTVLAMAAALGLDDAALDALFISAATIEA
jgi:hypothetical protein